jgi:uncharacterized membrane-anchored protein YhcB (DUF1043 family)
MKRTNADVVAALQKVMERLDTYNDQLKEHMARTALLEAAIQAQEKHYNYAVHRLDERIEKQETAYNGLPRKLLELLSVAGAIAGLVKLLF